MQTSSGIVPLYKLRVEVASIEPTIWREVSVPADFSLFKLHEIIQVLMGWHDHHIHNFEINGKTYAIPDEESEETVIDERNVILQTVAENGTLLSYFYDFGDDWRIDMQVTEVFEPAKEIGYPVCFSGGHAGPLEDSGGVEGYEKLVNQLANPNDPEHYDAVVSAGKGFHPRFFDLDKANRRLRGMRTRSPERHKSSVENN